MNLYAILIALVLWIASVAGAGWVGMSYQAISDKAKNAEIKQAIEDTRKAANEGAADAISKIVVRNTTIQGKVETIVRDNPVYRDCQHDDAGMRLINDALAGSGTGPTGDRGMPRIKPP